MRSAHNVSDVCACLNTAISLQLQFGRSSVLHENVMLSLKSTTIHRFLRQSIYPQIFYGDISMVLQT